MTNTLYKIGVTGGIASGKSFVTSIIREQGFNVIDSDIIARDIVSPNQSGLAALVAKFGHRIIDNATGNLDRAALRTLIFNDEKARQEVDQLLHPIIFDEIEKQMVRIQHEGECVVFIDMPLLFETGYDRNVNESWLVWVTEAVQLTRLMHRNHYDPQFANKMIHAQLPLDAKRQKATTLIDNNGTMLQTQEQVVTLLDAIHDKIVCQK